MPTPNPSDIYDSLTTGILVVNDEVRIISANRVAIDLIGLNKKQIIGDSLKNILPGTEDFALAVLTTGQPRIGRHVIYNDTDLLVDVTCLNNGEYLGAVLQVRPLEPLENLTHLFKKYQRLSEKLDAIFNLSSDGIWLSDGHGVVRSINKASERLNGLKGEDVVGLNVREVVEKGIMDSSATLQVLEKRRRVDMLQYVPRTNKYLLLTGTPLFDEHDRISMVVVNERDLTQLNKMKAQLERERQVSRKYKDELIGLSLQELKEEKIVAESPKMTEVVRTALRLANMDVSNILLLGESGTGKGLLAKFIHNHSLRRDHPFVQINCAALPESLLEAELFGYEKGAFTGAHEQGKAGLFELAQKGTLFLDEIAEAPISAQAKLLKYLDDHEVMRLGGTRPFMVDCIVIAATNQDLEAKVKSGEFRKDLFYRLNTFTLHIPPLRERAEDIFELAAFFIESFNKRYGLGRKLSPKIVNTLQNYNFPGNVRELKGIIKKAVVMSDHDILDAVDLEATGFHLEIPDHSPAGSESFVLLQDEIGRVEREILEVAQRRCVSTREMAVFLGISQPTVVRKLKRYGLLPPSIQQ